MPNIQYSIHAAPESIPVAHSTWYPPVAVARRDPTYARLLLPDLASAQSEMTTVHQYLFQSWTIGRASETIRRTIERMAAVEQHHFSILGQLVALLGGAPECRSTEPDSYWRGNMVDYCRDLAELLEKNGDAEQYAARTYLLQAQEVKDPHVSRMLSRLAQDEELHCHIFRDFRAQLD